MECTLRKFSDSAYGEPPLGANRGRGRSRSEVRGRRLLGEAVDGGENRQRRHHWTLLHGRRLQSNHSCDHTDRHQQLATGFSKIVAANVPYLFKQTAPRLASCPEGRLLGEIRNINQARCFYGLFWNWCEALKVYRCKWTGKIAEALTRPALEAQILHTRRLLSSTRTARRLPPGQSLSAVQVDSYLSSNVSSWSLFDMKNFFSDANLPDIGFGMNF